MSQKDDKFELGALKTPFDARDYVFEVVRAHGEPAAMELPKTYLKEEDVFLVKNQGPNGACVAFATSTLKDTQEIRDTKIKGPTSPLFVYNLRPNAPDSGMYFRDAFTILKEDGICLEETFPYDPKSADKPTTDARREALSHKITAYAQVYTVEGIKEAILMNGPVVMGSGVYSYDTNFWDSSRSQYYGRHATALIGWDETGFIGQNSWGANWGDEGRFHVPFGEIGKHRMEYWTAVDEITGKDAKQISWSEFLWWRIKHNPGPWIAGGVGILVGLGLITLLLLNFL
jgi:C1A family cysteine protease